MPNYIGMFLKGDLWFFRVQQVIGVLTVNDIDMVSGITKGM
jgi:hypothetical protein